MSRINPFEKQSELQRVDTAIRTPKIPNANSTTPSRVGKKGTTIYFDVDAHRTLKELALEQDKPLDTLLREGVNLMLRQYNRKPIA